jgi:hypothetical protein
MRAEYHCLENPPGIGSRGASRVIWIFSSYIAACFMARIFERWLGNSAQSDKWKFCLSAARIPRREST